MPLRRLPALGPLRAFEAAARRGSFKAAAQELAVTPGAISQQIRGLEDDLGVKLFTRKVRSVSLTEQGMKLSPTLSAAFLQIRDAVDQVRPHPTVPLKLSASGPVVNKWLLPRLHRFSERYPDLPVTIQTSNALRECDVNEVCIHFNEIAGPGYFSFKLCDEFVLPLASPELVERLDLKTPTDIMRAPLLHLQAGPEFPPGPGWPEWFQSARIDPANAHRGMRFDARHADHALEAAVNSAGVVLGRRFLARTDVASKRLVCPFGPAIPMHVNYYVLCQEGEERRPDVAAIINWVREEAAVSPGSVASQAGVE